MGYYITINNTNILVMKEDFQNIYKKMCELNNYDELKRGGGYGKLEEQGESKWNPNKWFSWMPYNYPDLYSTMEKILEEVGFELYLDKDGNLTGMGYHNKSGNEDYFLSCFAGYVKDNSYIEFKGEGDDDYYRYVFKDNKMTMQRGEISIAWKHEHTYEYGEMSGEDKETARWKVEWEAKHKLNVLDHVVKGL